jgi:hypothetical protein
MSLILNFHTEISIIEGNPQTLPQIRIDGVEATRCLNVPVCAPHYNMQIRDMYSVYAWHSQWGTGGTNPLRGADKQFGEDRVIEIESYVNFQSFLKRHLISVAEISKPFWRISLF